jgi:cob(I)alamin adenosyltransferase
VGRLPNITLKAYGRGKFITAKPPEKEDIKLAEEALKLAEEIIQSREYDIVILDEINVALNLKLIELQEVMEMIKKKPENVEIVLTGRDALKKIIDLADLVTELKEIKHPFSKGFKARKGIEY